MGSIQMSHKMATLCFLVQKANTSVSESEACGQLAGPLLANPLSFVT